MDKATISYYEQSAQAIANRYEAVSNSLSAHFDLAFRNKSKVLDIGCGSGRDLATLSKLGHDCYGIDPTSEFVMLSQQLHPELSGRIATGGLPDLQPPFGGDFDAILCSAVLMHIDVADLAASATAIKSCLKAGGRLLYSVPSKRLDVVADNRDANGRLFIPDQSGRLQRIFEGLGFQKISTWANSDSMGRDGVEWESVLMELRGP
ncbi:bifunctional 2-polyprenyl-6-hydroxyphenol methylase/3-demethylubiquinol 3-O-methyltransferase UbiG [Rhodoferax sp. U11-2br]|uniref:class I SAM-dependent methyltransferase n=1 Tax=Rhodoferax sp. U11-2br TaxID=2838878 RepID=UPI001BE7D2B0|nr:class I SAM-dependent methyltransferase [Rhodoferax sp. U11-2br]MBT3066119.1 methyltransferase domain-containing protein [Rhodoferax sp. U11-2br]